MDDDRLTKDDAERLLRYAELTFRAVTDQRRRLAIIALSIAALFGLVALFGGFQSLSLRSQIDDVEDATLVEAVGVEIPDPRPAIERTGLRLMAFVWGVLAIASLIPTLLALLTYAVIRPPPPPRFEPAGPDPAALQPPM
jgi:type VI protein secretion system component VasF